MGSNKSPGSIVDDGSEFYRHFLQIFSAKIRDCEVESRITYFARDSRNISATSKPSVFGAPKPLVQRMRTP